MSEAVLIETIARALMEVTQEAVLLAAAAINAITSAGYSIVTSQRGET